MGRANPEHALLHKSFKDLWKEIEELARKELALMEQERALRESDAASFESGFRPFLAKNRESRFLGVGEAWSATGRRELMLGSAHSYVMKFGGLPEGSFVLLLPLFCGSLTHGAANPDAVRIPPVAVLAKIVGHPIPRDVEGHQRTSRAIGAYPGSALGIDPGTLGQLHDLTLKLRIEKVIGSDEVGRARYMNGIGFSIPAIGFAAFCCVDSLLEALLNLAPTNESMRIGELRFSEHLPNLKGFVTSETPRCEVRFDPRHLLRSRSAFLGASGSGKSNLIKNVLLTLKGPGSPWAERKANGETIGVLLLDPQGEYAQRTAQGVSLAELVNDGARQAASQEALAYVEEEKKKLRGHQGIDWLAMKEERAANIYRPRAKVYAFDPGPGAHAKVLKINAYMEPASALELFAKAEGSAAGYWRTFVSLKIASPFDLLRRFWSGQRKGVRLGKAFEGFRVSLLAMAISGSANEDESTKLLSDCCRKCFGGASFFDQQTARMVSKALVRKGREMRDLAEREGWDMLPSARDSHIGLYLSQWVISGGDSACSQQEGDALRALAKEVVSTVGADELQELRLEWAKTAAFWVVCWRAGYEADSNLTRWTLPAWEGFFSALGARPFWNPVGSKGIDVPDAMGPLKASVRSRQEYGAQMGKTLDAMVAAMEMWTQGGGREAGAGRGRKEKQSMSSQWGGRQDAGLAVLENMGAPPSSGKADGFEWLMPHVRYHSGEAYNVIGEVIEYLLAGGLAIVNLADTGSGSDARVKSYFSEKLCHELFQRLTAKFPEVGSGGEASADFNVLVALEEAQELMPSGGGEAPIYKRMALMGRKLGLGVMFATQSPTNLDPELFKQLSIAFALNLPSIKEAQFLCDQQPDFAPVKDLMTEWARPGLGHFWRKNGLVIPMQADAFPSAALQPKKGEES